MPELWGMRSTPSLPSFRSPLWSGVVAPDRILYMGPMYGSNRTKLRTYVKLNCLK